ncbi:MAG: hypothetical protein KatS3mg085_584 [Candidatus Dojkabacteria bacterium]|nr:MAG: hypothetical protein KatS3mg085_584 [Candidatus Dojkabacteria bacterium]
MNKFRVLNLFVSLLLLLNLMLQPTVVVAQSLGETLDVQIVTPTNNSNVSGTLNVTANFSDSAVSYDAYIGMYDTFEYAGSEFFAPVTPDDKPEWSKENVVLTDKTNVEIFNLFTDNMYAGYYMVVIIAKDSLGNEVTTSVNFYRTLEFEIAVDPEGPYERGNNVINISFDTNAKYQDEVGFTWLDDCAGQLTKNFTLNNIALETYTCTLNLTYTYGKLTDLGVAPLSGTDTLVLNTYELPTVDIVEPTSGTIIDGTLSVKTNFSDNTERYQAYIGYYTDIPGYGYAFFVDPRFPEWDSGMVTLGSQKSNVEIFNLNTETFPVGQYTVIVYAFDHEGRESYDSVNFEVVDETAPTIEIITPTMNEVLNDNIRVSARFSGDVTTYDAYLAMFDFVEIGTETFFVPLTPADKPEWSRESVSVLDYNNEVVFDLDSSSYNAGYYMVTITAYDDDGNSSFNSVNFFINLELDLLVTPGTSVLSGLNTVNFNLTSNALYDLTFIDWALDCEEIDYNVTNFQVSNIDTSYECMVQAEYNYGRLNEWGLNTYLIDNDYVEIEVYNNVPSVAINTSPSTNVESGTIVSLTANATGGDGTLTYNWFGNCSGTTPQVTLPSVPGTYTCTVTVTDVNGDTASDSVTVTVNPQPTTQGSPTPITPTTPTPTDTDTNDGEVLGESIENEEQQETAEVLGVETCSEDEMSTIKGYVYVDENENSLYDEGEGINRVRISVYSVSDNKRTLKTIKTTDSNGEWSLDTLCAGKYEIEIRVEDLEEDLSVESSKVEVNLDEKDYKEVNFRVLRAKDNNGFNYLYLLIPALLLAFLGAGAVGYKKYSVEK